MPDVMMWVTGAGDEGASNLEAVGRKLQGLNYVSEVDVRTEGNVMHVFFEGGRAEQGEIKRAVREAGYDIFKVSHRE